MLVTNLSPRAQLRAGRLPLRFFNLFIGLSLWGLASAMMIRANLGVGPWDVLHIGLAGHSPLSLGTVVILVGVAVLLLWIPLRLWPGVGTICNAIWIGVSLDVCLHFVPEVHGLGWQLAVLAAAIVINGFAGALYIGCHLGTGPRDGLMTGLHLRTGHSIRSVRTAIELVALLAGWLLGGPVGVGTIAFALLIGPATQFFFPWTTVRLPAMSGDPQRAAHPQKS